MFLSVTMDARLLAHVICAAAAALLLLVVWMVFVERRRFRVRRVVLDADAMGLPQARILHVTDTHFHGRDRAILRFLERLAREHEFDLVVLTGDLIDGADGVRSAGHLASLFKPQFGTFAVLGGHDYGNLGTIGAYRHLFRRHSAGKLPNRNPAEELVEALTRAGVRVLDDEHAVTDIGTDGEQVAIVGLRDAFVSPPDFDAAWDGLPARVPTVVLAHSPDIVEEVVARGAALAFFGHTHGGQVRFPFVGALVTRSRLPGPLASGTFRWGGTITTTNNGLGTSPATPFRLLCRPEVTILELRHNAPSGTVTPIEDVGLDRLRP